MDVDLNKFLEETSATTVNVAKENASEDDENVGDRRRVSSVFKKLLDDLSRTPNVNYFTNVHRNKEIRLSI